MLDQKWPGLLSPAEYLSLYDAVRCTEDCELLPTTELNDTEEHAITSAAEMIWREVLESGMPEADAKILFEAFQGRAEQVSLVVLKDWESRKVCVLGEPVAHSHPSDVRQWFAPLLALLQLQLAIGRDRSTVRVELLTANDILCWMLEPYSQSITRQLVEVTSSIRARKAALIQRTWHTTVPARSAAMANEHLRTSAGDSLAAIHAFDVYLAAFLSLAREQMDRTKRRVRRIAQRERLAGVVSRKVALCLAALLGCSVEFGRGLSRCICSLASRLETQRSRANPGSLCSVAGSPIADGA
jgi:hypothetical protein